jgi:hypothetical protein
MEIILSLLTGGATGIIGSAIGKFFGFLKSREDRATQAMNNKHVERLHELTLSSEASERESEERIASTAAAVQMQAGSHKHDASYGSVGLRSATALRFVRPIITFALIGLVAVFWFTIGMDNELIDGNAMKTQIISTVLYITTVAITWWFGDRAPDWLRSKR